MPELFNAAVTLARFPGKGGWTYAPVGVLAGKPKTHFGVLKVRGRMDEVVLDACHLMPMGQGQRFLPVNAALRKQLGKQAGDIVQLQLFAVEDVAEPGIALADFIECLAEVPAALRAFQELGPTQQQAWLRWVNEVRTDQQQISRVESALVQLAQGWQLPVGATT